MKKNKGFTLIELLAVIVVLVIIALIATPIVMNTIKNTEKGATEQSIVSYIRQVELTIATEELDKHYVEDGTYDINEDGNLIGNGLSKPLIIEMNGTKPGGGKVTISDSQIEKEKSFMTIKEYTVSYDTDKKTFVTKTLEVLCTKADGVNLSNLTYGNKFTCELGDNNSKIFYVLEISGDNVSLIMDRNINREGKGTTEGIEVAWCKSGDDNSCAADGALEYLALSTKKSNSSQISLPTYDQIYIAAGNKSSGSTTWLHENLKDSGAPWGYWTLTPSATYSNHAWYYILMAILPASLAAVFAQ